jgi:hypothetical protein
MNNFNIAFMDMSEDGMKRIVKDIVSDIKVFLDVDDNNPVWINNSFDNTLDKIYNDNNFTKQPGDKRIEVTFTETIDDNDYNTVLQSMGGLVPIFHDTELNVILSPIISSSKLNLSIMFYNRSKVFLDKIVTKLRMRDSLIRKDFRHKEISTISYIDNRVIMVLKEINNLRKLKYTETLSDYLVKYATSSLKQVNSGSVNQKNTLLAVFDKYENVTGKLVTESNGLKVEYNNEDNRYELNIDYEVYINKPITLNIKYPYMVFNQLLNPKFIQRIDPYKHYSGEVRYVDIYDKLRPIHPRLQTNKSNQYVHIPDFDTYTLKDNCVVYKKVFAVLMVMLNEDKTPIDSNTPILNLKELGVVKFNDQTLTFLNSEYEYLNKLHLSVFHISIYENDRRVDSLTSLRIDSDLNVYFLNEVKIDRIYRLAFNICIDPNCIADSAYNRALEGGMINILNNVVVVDDKINYELYSTEKDFKVVSRNNISLPRTVQTTTIQAAGLLENLK